ncbi:hypothetical protein B9T07_25880 [Limnospira fusiformis CCALA 023]
MRMVRSALLIFNQGAEVPTRRLFQVFQPYFMPERLALCIFIYQTLGHINSYGMVRVRIPYISPRGKSPTRRLFHALQPYLTPKHLAPYLSMWVQLGSGLERCD